MTNKLLQFNYMRWLFFSLLLCMLFAPGHAKAAEISVNGKTTGEIGKTLNLPVLLNTQSELINTVAGTILIDQNIKVTGVSQTDKNITFWLLRPTLFSREDGLQEIRFSGSVAGGMNGDDIQLFALSVVPTTTDEATLSWTNAEALVHDGFGTRAQTTGKGTALTGTVAPAVETPLSPEVKDENTSDTTPPEMVAIIRTRDRNLFDGKWTLIFNARDPETGISRYEVQESSNGQVLESQWKLAESPYVLDDQENKNTVFVKVTNNTGLSIIFSNSPAPTGLRFGLWLKIGISVVILLLFFGAFKLLKRKNTAHEV